MGPRGSGDRGSPLDGDCGGCDSGTRCIVSRRALASLVALVAALEAGCAPHVRLAPAAEFRACAAVIDAAGQAARERVAWLRPDDGDDRRTLDAWCEGVGPAVAAGTAAHDGVGPASRLAILTWNARVGGGDLPRLVQDLRGGVLTGGRPVEHFVLLVQEAFRTGPSVPGMPRDPRVVPKRIAPGTQGAPRVDIVSTAGRLGLALYYVPSMRNGRGDTPATREDRGNAILSTLPLSDLQAFELPFERQRRVVIAARVTGTRPSGEPWAVRVVNVHLENRAGASRLWLRSGAARARQAAALVEQLPTDLPLVLGGDLNTWMGSSEPALATIRRAFPAGAETLTGPTFAGGLRLDYLFDRIPPGWSMRQQLVSDRFASDHHPILGELRIP